MQSVSEIRHHIGAVKETRKITNAMQMVSSARMKKFAVHIPYNHDYYKKLQTTMKEILESSQQISHPYLLHHKGHRRTYIVISGDKGMAGSYNSTILNYAYKEIKEKPYSHLITVGITANQFFRKRGMIPTYETAGIAQNPSLYNAQRLADQVMELFDTNQTDEVYIIYTLYAGKNGHVENQPRKNRILPLRLTDFQNVEVDDKLN